MKDTKFDNIISKDDSPDEIEEKLRKVTRLMLVSYSATILLNEDFDKTAEKMGKAWALADFLYVMYIGDDEKVFDIAEIVCNVEDRDVVKIGFTKFLRGLEVNLLPVCVSFMQDGDDKLRIFDCIMLCRKVNREVDKLLKIAGIEDEYPFHRILVKDVTQYLEDRFNI